MKDAPSSNTEEVVSISSSSPAQSRSPTPTHSTTDDTHTTPSSSSCVPSSSTWDRAAMKRQRSHEMKKEMMKSYQGRPVVSQPDHVVVSTSTSSTNPEDELLRSFSPEQRLTYDVVVKKHRSVFITGGAGTGKSHLLRAIIAALPIASTFVTATTGIAALNLGGCTLHSFAGCGIVERGTSRYKILSAVRKKRMTAATWKRCTTLIIDEVSMLDPWFFSVLDFVARRIRSRSHEPFGGMQLVLSGDFLQLPPIIKHKSSSSSSSSSRMPNFCFETLAWMELNPQVCLLSTAFRQRQHDFFAILNEMRFGELSTSSVTALSSISRSSATHATRITTTTTTASASVKQEPGGLFPLDDATSTNTNTTTTFVVSSTTSETQPEYAQRPFDGYINLRPRVRDVTTVNEYYYHQLQSTEYVYVGYHSGVGTFPDKSLPKYVRLRVGCRVMLIKNRDVSGGLVNGTTGEVVGFIAADKCGPNNNAHYARHICRGVDHQANLAHNQFPVIDFSSALAPGGKGRLGERFNAIVMGPEVWEERRGDELISSTVQIPLVHAYAITIHKSQGMTLTSVDVDLQHVFETGQAYVALSRCTDLASTRLSGFRPHLAIPNATALTYYKALELRHKLMQWRTSHMPEHATTTATTSGKHRRLEVDDEDDEEDESGEDACDVLSSGSSGIYDDNEEEVSRPSEDDDGDGDDDDEGGRRGKKDADDESIHSLPRRLPRNASAKLERLRRRVVGVLEMAAAVQERVEANVVDARRVRNMRLVLDVSALFDLVTGDNSANQFDVIFTQHNNMMRVPQVVMTMLSEAAAWRTSTAHTQASNTSTPPITSAGVDDDVDATTTAQATELMEAADVAVEALMLIQRAKEDLLMDRQTEEQDVALPPPHASWTKYAPILPLLLMPPDLPPTQNETLSHAHNNNNNNNTSPTVEELLLHRDPRERDQHVRILRYAEYLRQTFGPDVMICTDSTVLAAYALAYGFDAVSVERCTSATNAA